MRISFLLAAAMSLAAGANAGVLYEVEIESTTPIVGGVVITTIAQTNGSSTSNSATWGGGSAFAGTTAILSPTTSVVSTLTIVAGNHSALSVTGGGAVTGGVQASSVCAYLFGFCAISFTMIVGTELPPIVCGAFPCRPVMSGKWTTGVAVASGLTSLGNALPNVTTTGSFNLTAYGGGTITLVTATTLAISGPAYGLQFTVATPSILRLRFVPEPGTSLLLGAGVLGLALVGRPRSHAAPLGRRRKKRAR